jgi:hypothetical protein
MPLVPESPVFRFVDNCLEIVHNAILEGFGALLKTMGISFRNKENRVRMRVIRMGSFLCPQTYILRAILRMWRKAYLQSFARVLHTGVLSVFLGLNNFHAVFQSV